MKAESHTSVWHMFNSLLNIRIYNIISTTQKYINGIYGMI